MKPRFRSGVLRLAPQERETGGPVPAADVVVTRSNEGVPTIRADSLKDAYYGLGYIQAYDRMFQMWFMKIVFAGRMSEFFGDREDLVAFDKALRKLNFRHFEDGEIESIPEDRRRTIDSYVYGVNDFRESGYRPIEFKLMRLTPEPWEIEDTVFYARVIGYFGLADYQSGTEMNLLRTVMRGTQYAEAFKEVFHPHLDGYDFSWYDGLKLTGQVEQTASGGSNNWAVAGRLAATSAPIFCIDPHLEISRLPCVWYEAVIDTPDLWMVGFTQPGSPAFLCGWNRKLAWGPTNSMADTCDYFVEQCRDGMYLKDGEYRPFRRRETDIVTRKGRKIPFVVYENEHGTLDGDPNEPGKYLSMKWSGYDRTSVGTFDAVIGFATADSVQDAMKAARAITSATVNWAFADSQGNIGFQMCGRIPQRGRGLSGILPLPGWDSAYDWQGFVPPEQLPSALNPDAGFVVTANNRMDSGGFALQNVTFASDRADRIAQLFSLHAPLTAEKMQQIQTDLYSHHADRVLSFVGKYLSHFPLGQTMLSWDRRYDADSEGAVLFEQLHHGLLLESGVGILFDREYGRFLLERTSLLTLNYHVFEDEWKKPDGIFKDVDWGCVVEKIMADLEVAPRIQWGRKHRLVLRHLLFGTTPLRFLGFNCGPIPLQGDTSTICQGSIDADGKVVGPSLRFIVDFAAERAYTVIPGGPSGRRLSRLYTSEFGSWRSGRYKVTQPPKES